MNNDIFEMACDLVNPDGGELNENQESEVQALVNFARSCFPAMLEDERVQIYKELLLEIDASVYPEVYGYIENKILEIKVSK